MFDTASVSKRNRLKSDNDFFIVILIKSRIADYLLYYLLSITCRYTRDLPLFILFISSGITSNMSPTIP